jgi:transcriptional regulator with XRE-family HTH domain
VIGPALFVALRDHLGISDAHGSVSAVARAIGVQRMTVQRWRDGTREPRAEQIAHVSRTLGVGIDLHVEVPFRILGTAAWVVKVGR